MHADKLAIDEVVQQSKRGAAHTVSHYLYLPTKAKAENASAQIETRGFNTKVRRGADGVSWLVLASHVVVVREEVISAARRTMEDVAAARGGEYDGWEVDVE